MGYRKKVRHILFHKDRCCHYCRRSMLLEKHPTLQLTIDHIIPVAYGGVDRMANFVGACTQCNNARGTLPYGLFKRYVSRFGPQWNHHVATRNWVRRRKLEAAKVYMERDGLPEERINDILKAKLELWMEQRARSSIGSEQRNSTSQVGGSSPPALASVPVPHA